MKTHEPRWTIEELVQRVERALAVDYDGQVSRRISDVPTLRNVRYYTTLGLLDRPAALRGRTAFYSLRHLMQLVSIKRLQAEGLSLTEIQNRLLGLSDSKLAKIAQLPTADWESVSEPVPTRSSAAPRRAKFWAAEPTETSSAVMREAARVKTWQSLELSEDVRLLIEGEMLLDAAAVREIQNAARPLLRTLANRRIRNPR
jgi:DNA-binding transcriptional MerR regulator